MLSALVTIALAASSDGAASEAINRAYTELAAHRAAGDVAGMMGHFAADGLLIDSRPGPAMSGAELAPQIKAMAARAATSKVTVHTDYRVERRSLMGDIAVDAGFARMRYSRTGPVAEGAPMPQTMLRRFMATWKRDSNGRWQIVADANFPATEAQWDALKPVAGLKFD